MNIPMILGGVGMLGYVVLWVMIDTSRVIGWPMTLKIFGRAMLVTAFVVSGLVLIVFGLGLK